MSRDDTQQQFGQKLMVHLCLAIIVLQVADAYSTYLSLSTGLMKENNHILLTLAQFCQAPVVAVVIVSKALIALLFLLVIKKSTATAFNVFFLCLVVIYYVHIVFMNVFWYFMVENAGFKSWVLKFVHTS